MAERSPSLAREQAADSQRAETVRAALAQIADGGYPAAVARIAFLLKDQGRPLPLSRLQLKADLIREYADLLPETTPDEQRRIRGTQEIIVGDSPAAALATLPQLVGDPADAARLETLLDKLIKDERILAAKPTTAQKAMLARIRQTLATPSLPPPAVKKTVAKSTKKAPAAASARKVATTAKPARATAKVPPVKPTEG
jgi:hypothetical protein